MFKMYYSSFFYNGLFEILCIQYFIYYIWTLYFVMRQWFMSETSYNIQYIYILTNIKLLVTHIYIFLYKYLKLFQYGIINKVLLFLNVSNIFTSNLTYLIRYVHI